MTLTSESDHTRTDGSSPEKEPLQLPGLMKPALRPSRRLGSTSEPSTYASPRVLTFPPSLRLTLLPGWRAALQDDTQLRFALSRSASQLTVGLNSYAEQIRFAAWLYGYTEIVEEGENPLWASFLEGHLGSEYSSSAIVRIPIAEVAPDND